MGSKIFRKVALDRLSSPEQLDQLMQVTEPRGWLALGALGLLLVTAAVWGVTGSVPTQVHGTGLLLRPGGVVELVATGTGQLEAIRVGVGDQVRAGQVVATVRQDGTLRGIEENEARQRALTAEYRDLERYVAEQRRLADAAQAQRRANLRRTIETLETNIALLTERREAQRSLLDKGLITQQTLLDTEQELNRNRDELASLRLELEGFALERLEERRLLEQQLDDLRRQRRDLDLEQKELRASLEENANVVSPHSGRVIELALDLGDVVAPGTAILTMEVAGEDLVAVLFVPADAGKQVRVGMDARISPATVKREEHGFLLGEVTWIADFPSTSRGMERLLGNADLVDRLMAEGPPIQVDVRLRRDPTTPSGYAWSSTAGPAIDISSGTTSTGSIVVRRDRPISMVLPEIRKGLGQ